MQPFQGIKVLDLTHVLAGPFCAYQLSVMGADVLKIEGPDMPDMSRIGGHVQHLGTNFLTQASNKRAMTLNLKSKEGQDILKKLAGDADVLVENYRAGALEALGLGWKDLEPINPKLIYCSMTGFGQNGPKRGHTAYDNVIQAVSGLMSITGTPESAPLKAGGAVLDYGTGIMAAFAVSCALFQRVQTGKGQRIDVSMMDSAFMLMGSTMVGHFCGANIKPAGNDTDNATYSCYQTKDGMIMLGAGQPNQRRRFWNALGRPEDADRIAKMSKKQLAEERGAIADLVREIMLEKTADEWVLLLNAAHVPAERVRSIADAAAHPQVAHRGVFHTHKDFLGAGKDLKVPVAAFSYEHGGPSVRSAPPAFGEHTDEVLGKLGYAKKDIKKLRQSGVV